MVVQALWFWEIPHLVTAPGSLLLGNQWGKFEQELNANEAVPVQTKISQTYGYAPKVSIFVSQGFNFLPGRRPPVICSGARVR